MPSPHPALSVFHRRARVFGLSALALLGSLAAPLQAGASDDGPYRVFYFGNSLLENSIPWFQPTLAATAGEDLEMTSRIGPGWQIWMHVDRWFIERPEGGKAELESGDWDAVLIHQFGRHPGVEPNVRDKVWHNQKPFPEPRDVSDPASAAVIIEALLESRPDDGVAFIYSSWPGIPGAQDVQKRVKEETESSYAEQGLEREEVLQKVKERKATLEELTPVLEAFDYGALWTAPYRPEPGDPASVDNSHSRDYVDQLMTRLAERFPELAAEDRLRLIPNGEVLYALDQKARAGELPGVSNIGFFSRDGLHIRAGLPRYTIAATVFAVMFERHPGELDAAIYNDIDNYTNEYIRQIEGKIGSGYIHGPDLGELLPITPERKKVVDDTVWEVVTSHPHSRVNVN